MNTKSFSLAALIVSVTCCFDSAAQDSKPETSLPESALLLSKFIQYESITGNERPAGEFLASVCREKALHVEILSDEKDSYNFAASLYPLSSGKPNIVFLNHLDVVPPGDTASWTYPPFSGVIADSMVWGRGSIDLKGLAIMQVLAISSLTEQSRLFDLPYNVTVLCVSQEEDGSTKGTQRVVSEHFDKLQAEVVFGEGGAGVDGLLDSNPEQIVFCISTGEKQALWLRLRVKIPSSGHGSVPPAEYANKVIVQALSRLMTSKQKISISSANVDMFESLGKIEKGLKGFVLRNIRLFKPLIGPMLRKDPKVLAIVSNTITLTNLSNPSGATNQIAQEVTASLDCRLLPGTNQKKFIAEISKTLKKTNVFVDVELETVNAIPSSIKTEFFQNFKLAIQEVYPGTRVVPYLFPAYSDNNYFRNMGIPVYGIKPVHLSKELLLSIHNVDERLPIKCLEQGIEVYKSFLDKILVPSTTITALN